MLDDFDPGGTPEPLFEEEDCCWESFFDSHTRECVNWADPGPRCHVFGCAQPPAQQGTLWNDQNPEGLAVEYCNEHVDTLVKTWEMAKWRFEIFPITASDPEGETWDE